MARNGSGTASLLNTLAPPGQVNNPTNINATMDDIATMLTDSINKDGTKPWATNQPMAGFKFTGMGAGSAAGDSGNLGQIQSGVVKVATTVGGTVDAITLIMTPATLAWTTNEEFTWVSGGANTLTAPTINKDGFGPKTIKKGASVALAVGDLGASGTINTGFYNGTDVILRSSVPSAAFVGGVLTATTSMSGKGFNEAKGANIASAGTTDIWTPADGNYGHITGVTTITSLGTAPQAGAHRVLVFDGILTLTHNATTLILPGAANITTAAGDWMEVYADTTANMKVDYHKVSGASIVGGFTARPLVVKTSGTTYTTPAGCTQIIVEVIGGGGAGAASNGGGGGGGGYAKKLYTVTPSTGYTYAVGAAAGNSTFTDGTTLITGSGGTNSPAAGVNAVGGAGGTGTNGDVNLSGAKGGTGDNTNVGGQGGGSGGGWGQGGGSGHGTTAGGAGALYGGGGGGGSGGAAGAGAAGAVIITEIY